jgi:hypothetical protein
VTSTVLTLQYGLSDVITHMQDVEAYFGDSPPANVSPALVLAPLQSAQTMQAMQTQISALTAAVIAGTTTVASATATVTALIAQLNALMPAANTAIQTLQAAKPTLAPGLAAGSMGLTNNVNLQTLSTLLNSSSPVLVQFQGEMETALLPITSAINPSIGSVSGGLTVVITGSYFLPNATVAFGNIQATNVQIVSPTEIACVSPEGTFPGNIGVFVTTTGGDSNAITFTYE